MSERAQLSGIGSEPGGLGYSLEFHYAGVGNAYWEDLSITLTPDMSKGTPDTGQDREWDAVRQAISSWNEATGTLRLSLGRSASCEPGSHDFGFNPPISCVGWVPILPDNALAATDYWTCPLVGNDACLDSTINEVDIRFSDNYAWSLDPQPGEIDVQGIATHELGHAIGLHHVSGSNDEMQTMYQFRERVTLGVTPTQGSLMDRSLFWGDIAGAETRRPHVLPPLGVHCSSLTGNPVRVAG